MASRRFSSAADGNNTGDGDEVGLFIPLPEELASQYPSLAPHDLSSPHVTFLCVGAVPPSRRREFADVCSDVLSQIPRKVTASLSGADYFVNPGQGKVAHSVVVYDYDMAGVRSRLREALLDAGFRVKDRFPVYRPHVTLAYLDGFDATYTGDIPSGSWEFSSIQVWGLPSVIDVKFGARSVTSGGKTKSYTEREDEEVKRLSRPSPKKKPPRKDVRRERLKVDKDPDVDTGDRGSDPDLSLNYKKVGSRLISYRDTPFTRVAAEPNADPHSGRTTHTWRASMPNVLSKKGARSVTATLDRIANLFEHDYAAMGINRRLAHDFARRCDLLSDHLEKIAGDFNPGELSDVHPSGPLEGDADESYMKGEFTEEENEELRKKQESGSLPKVEKKAALKALAKAAGIPLSVLAALSRSAADDSEEEEEEEETKEGARGKKKANSIRAKSRRASDEEEFEEEEAEEGARSKKKASHGFNLFA